MEFIETTAFTEDIIKLLPDDDYLELQDNLRLRPRAGVVIPGCHGIRPLRWQAKGHGKRGGVRVIYYYIDDRGVIIMLYVYAKNELEDLTAKQRAVLTKYVQRCL